MTKINDGGPAFPMPIAGCNDGSVYNTLEQSSGELGGMSLRDYFAAKVMQGAMVNARFPGLDDGDPGAIALLSKACNVVYIVADAMLKARGNTP